MKLNIKSTVVILVGAVITVALAIYIPRSLQTAGKDAYKEKKDDIVASTDESTSPSPETDNNMIQQDTVPVEAEPQTELQEAEPDSTPRPEDVDIDNAPEQPEEASETDTETQQEPKRYSREWAEKKIQEHKDEIDAADLENFRYIMGKIGEGTVMSTFEGGMSEQEQSELYNRIRNTLTEQEYEEAKTLFAKYNWILYEE